MRFNDLIDPERGPQALGKLALYPLITLIGFSLVLALLAQLPPTAEFLLLCLVFLLSPLAYAIRRNRQGGARPGGARRGSERTPLVPMHEEDQ
jgi:hypothetical protein